MMLQLWVHLLSALFFIKDGAVVAHESTLLGQTQDITTTSSPKTPTPQTQLQPVSGSVFTLKVLVNERVSGHQLNKATVEVYVNHTRTNTAVTGEDGVVLLHISYQLGLPLTIVASMQGYILNQLPWKTTKVPIFSSVTLSLLSLSQGNVWLFEDLVLITDRTSGSMQLPSVQFPKRLLNLTNSDFISSVKAYIAVPKISTGRDSYPDTMGLLIGRFGYSSIELSPVVALSVQLYSDEREIQLSGPIQISVPIPDTSGLQSAEAVPAWLFDRNTGAWMNSGLGVVNMVEGKKIWTFNASHLGYWIVAPLPLTPGYIGLAMPVDFISSHTFFLMAIVGGTIFLLIGVLTVLLCGRRTSLSHTKAKRICSMNTAVSRMDQTTSMYDSELCEVSSQESLHLEPNQSTQSVTGGGVSSKIVDFVSCRHNGNLNIYVEESGLTDVQLYGSPVDAQPENSGALRRCPLKASSSELPSSHGISELTRVPHSAKEGVFFEDGLVHLCNQPLTILHAPALFHLQEQPPQSQLATLPRTGTPNHAHPEPGSNDSFTQTPPKGDPLCLHQGPCSERQPRGLEERQGPSSSGVTWCHYSNSEQALEERSDLSGGKSPSPRPPRAWFVSLEGKPAAEIHRSVADTQRGRRPTDSRDTSLDSGVDMSEPSQQANRRPLKLEHGRTFVKSLSQSKPLPSEEVVSNKKGATLAKDLAQGNMLDIGGDGGTVSNFTEDSGELLGNSEQKATPVSQSHVQAKGT